MLKSSYYCVRTRTVANVERQFLLGLDIICTVIQRVQDNKRFRGILPNLSM